MYRANFEKWKQIFLDCNKIYEKLQRMANIRAKEKKQVTVNQFATIQPQSNILSYQKLSLILEIGNIRMSLEIDTIRLNRFSCEHQPLEQKQKLELVLVGAEQHILAEVAVLRVRPRAAVPGAARQHRGVTPRTTRCATSSPRATCTSSTIRSRARRSDGTRTETTRRRS